MALSEIQRMTKDGRELRRDAHRRQVLVDQVKSGVLEEHSFPVRRTTRSRLREVDFLALHQTAACEIWP